MKSKILKIFLTVLLVFTFTMTDFIFLGYKVSVAMYEELESQSRETNVKNVEFDAYFLNDNQKVHSKECDLDSKETLILNVNVKDKGSLNDAKIKLENTNFTILKDEVNSQYVKSINADTNEIELNQIIYQNNVEIVLPITFKKQDSFDVDYFEKENNITITGNYFESEDKSEEVSSQIKTRVIWKHSTDVTLMQSIDKYINLNNKVLLQQNITTSVQDNKLPRENESLEVKVPVLDDQKPSKVRVLLNGDKMQDDKAVYNNETGIVQINNESNGVWSLQNNVYKLIYEYENVEFTNKNISLNTNMTTKLYTQDNVQKNDSQNIEISPIGNVVSIEKQTTDSKYKGYLYANSSNLTVYDELEKIEISNESEISNLEIAENQENFLDGNGNQFDISSKTVYQETMFNKENIINLLGQDGVITIKDVNGSVLSVINSQSMANEVGNIVVSYASPVKGITISTTKPINVGTLLIRNKKGIEGNTGYSREQLKQFTTLSSMTKVSTNISEQVGEARTNLLDTTTEASLEINNVNLSTLQKNENVQFTVTLKTSSENYDLFKNPVIEITLPSCISNLTVKSINKVYADEFGVEYARLVDRDNGEKVMQIALSGEQSDYSNEINQLSIVINADIEFDILTPSQKTNVSMTYTNENGNEGTYNTSVEINVSSKPGMMIYNNLSGFNNNGDSIYTVDNNIPVGTLSLNSNSNTATINTAVINNYDTDINNVVIIGRLPKKGVNGATLDTTLLQGISTNVGGAEVSYSPNISAVQDDGSWSGDYTNASSYMIKLGTMTAGQVVTVGYQVSTPENIGYGESIYAQTETTYTYLGNVSTQSSTVGAKTEEIITDNILALENTVTREANNVGVAISTVSGGVELEDGTSVYEGQKVRYTMQITNNTGADLNNVNIKATQTNGNLYDLVEYEAFDPAAEEGPSKIYHLYGELNTNEKTFDTIDTLANGESIVVSYEIVVSEVDGDSEQTYGDVLVTADGMEDINISTIKNNISQAELKLTMASSFFEEETINLGRKVHMNLSIGNISGETLDNVRAKVELPEGVYCNSETDLVWESTSVAGEDRPDTINRISNIVYDRESNTLTFEIQNMEAEEFTKMELYVEMDNFEEEEKDISFMYEATATNTYVSNMATIKVHNEQKNVGISQSTNIDENIGLKDEDVFDLTITVENREQEELMFEVTDSLPEGFTAKSAVVKYMGSEEQIPITSEPIKEDEDQNAFVIRDNILGGGKLLSGNTSMEIVVTIEIDAEKIATDTVTNRIDLSYGKLAEEGPYEYEWSYLVSTEKDFTMQKVDTEENWVEVIQTANPENDTIVEDGQEVTYTFEIKNTTNNEISTTLYDYIPKGIIVDSVTLDGEELEAGDVYIEGHKIAANETSKLEIIGHVAINQVPNNEIVNNLTVSTVMGDITSNDIVYRLSEEENPEEPDNPDNPDNPGTEDPDNPDNPGNPDNPSGDGEYTISGVAWIDENKDGRRDSTEKTLSGVGVKVIDAESGMYIDNINVTTEGNGQYEINVNEGSYILVFEYDTQRYILTEYRKAGVDENQNSDVISKSIMIDGVNNTVGATDTINVSEDTTNIDIGLIEASTFDLELDKYVSEITVQTNKGTTQYSYGEQTLARVEIHSREVNNATVIIKYTIKIRNTGEVAGYVQNIVDYIPSDLNFNSELNKDWYQSNTNLQNNSLSNTPIGPGEETTVDLVLVKNMTEDNTGTVINIAEIAQASNPQGLNDSDSTPGNNNASEDDYGKAEVIIGISTGRVIIFVSIIFAILAIIAAGVYIINKKVLKKDNKKI